MSEPSLALQAAIFAVLKDTGSSPPVPIVDRVYDRVPAPVPPALTPTFPYVTIGGDEVQQDAAECLEGSVEVTATIEVWSQAVGKIEAKTISGAIVSAISNADLTLSGYRLVLIQHDATRHLGDPDGITSHSVITFRALIDEA
jgi:hypothetical protein